MTTASDIDIIHLRRALALAVKGRGCVEPNPMVGCVIAKEDRVIGEGYHQRFGGPHAEPNALASCTESPAGATAYITLEPCCHSNKKTPPCVPALIAAKLRRVVVGCADPNPSVSGRGIAQLKAAGIDVVSGLLKSESMQLNAAFFAHVVHRRPYVTLKWVESADQKVAGPAGRRVQIGGEEANRAVHGLRARSDAILVGIQTLLNDNPRLTARDVPHPRPLTRIVLDSSLRTDPAANLFADTPTSPVIICCSEDAYAQRGPAFLSGLRHPGTRVLPLPMDKEGRLSIPHLLEELGRHSMTHLLVEPGPTLARSMLRRNLCDRLWIFRSPDRIDDPTAPDAPEVRYPTAGEIAIGRDRLTEYFNPQSPVFFANAPSADLLQAAEAQTSAGVT